MSMPKSVQAMVNDPKAATAPLKDFLPAYEKDDNIWWYLNSGHHQNLFEMAVDQLEEVLKTMDDYKIELRKKVNALVHAGDYDQMGKNFYVRLDDVLSLIDTGEPIK